MADIIQQRRDTAARWKQYNPILLEGEVGYVTDNPNQYKIGDGKTPWNSLPLRGYTGTITQDTGIDENAVMSQKAVTEKLSELGSEVFSSSFFELGSIDSNDGSLIENTTGTRIRTKDFIKTKGKVVIDVPFGNSYTIMLRFYNNGKYVGHLDNAAENIKELYELSFDYNGVYDSVKIVCAPTLPVTESTINGKYAYGDKYSDINARNISENKSQINTRVDNIEGLLVSSSSFELGSIDSSDGSLIENATGTRIRTKDYINAKEGSVISINLGLLYMNTLDVMYYNDNLFVGSKLIQEGNLTGNVSVELNHSNDFDRVLIRFTCDNITSERANDIIAISDETLDRQVNAIKNELDVLNNNLDDLESKSLFELGSIDSVDGSLIENTTGTRIRTKNYIYIGKDNTIKLSLQSRIDALLVRYYNNGRYVGSGVTIEKVYYSGVYNIEIPQTNVEYNSVKIVLVPNTPIVNIDNSMYAVSYVSKQIILDTIQKIGKNTGSDAFNPCYIPMGSLDGKEDSVCDVRTIRVADLYNLWQELASKHPSFLKIETVGKDSSGEYEIKKINFSIDTKSLTVNSSTSKRKVVIIANIHGPGPGGDTRMQSVVVYSFIKWILENKNENVTAQWFAMNYEYVIIPIANPWGYDNSSRGNANNVDLNRNFDINWESGESYAGTTHGNSAADQIETQIIQSMLQENKNAYAFLDFHSHMEDSPLLQILTVSTGKMFEVGKYVTRLCKITDAYNIQLYTDLTGGGARLYGEFVCGIESATLEGIVNDGNALYTSKAATDTMRMFANMMRYGLLPS